MRRSVLATLSQRLSRLGDGAVDVGVPAGDGFWGKRGEWVGASGGAERGTAIRPFEESIDRGGEGTGRNIARQKAGPVMLDDVGQSSRIERDHGGLAELRFDGDEPQSFIDGRN